MNDQINDYIKQHEPSICLLIPCYSGNCNIKFINSLIATIDLCKMNRIRCRHFFMEDDNSSHRVRNNLVAKALAIDGITHILFIHENVVWNPRDIFKLLLSNKYIVGGACPKKHINWKNIVEHPTCVSAFNEKNNTPIPNEIFLQNKLCDYKIKLENEKNININKNITKVDKISFDFVMLKRNVFEKLFSAFPSAKYIDENILNEDENKFAYTLFDSGKEKNTILSYEDVFCRRWKNIGGSIWMNVTIELSVVGDYQYHGNFYNSLI